MNVAPSYALPRRTRLSELGFAAALVALGLGIAVIFLHFARDAQLDSHLPEFIGLALAAGAFYLAAVYLVENFRPGGWSLVVILAGALAFRIIALPAPPPLSEDIYRYQWEGRVVRAGANPYLATPSSPGLAGLEDQAQPLRTGRSTAAIYPPLMELVFSWVKTVPGYKRLFTVFDLASVLVLLLLLDVKGEPLCRVVAYAWNPGVVISFALCGHHDALAILTLLAANLFIISGRPALSIAFLALSFLSKLFAGALVPVFLRRGRWWHAGVFAGLVVAGYAPFSSAGLKLFQGLGNFARGWESNDSLFRLIRMAGNNQAQSELIAAALVAGIIAYAAKRRMEPLRASLFIIAALLFLSPDAFPWYFTWFVPFLCFYPEKPLLLASVISVLGYAPVVAYSAGQPYRDSPFILTLEYAPVFACLAWSELRRNTA